MRVVAFIILCSLMNPAWAGSNSKHEPTVQDMVYTTLMMKLVFQLKRIQTICKDDIQRLCKNVENLKQPGCILSNRSQVSKGCESLLTQEFGSLPTKKSFVYKGFTIPKHSKVYRYMHNDNIVQVVTTEPTTYKGIRLQAGRFLFQSDTISPIPLTEVREIDGIKFSPPSVAFSFDGFVQSGILAENTNLNGIAFKAGTGISFLKKGVVAGGTLLRDVTIDGVMYKKDWDISFYPSGKVKMGVLAKPMTIHGKHLDSNTTIAYNPDGSINYSFPIHASMLNKDGSRKEINFLEEMEKALHSQ